MRRPKLNAPLSLKRAGLINLHLRGWSGILSLNVACICARRRTNNTISLPYYSRYFFLRSCWIDFSYSSSVRHISSFSTVFQVPDKQNFAFGLSNQYDNQSQPRTEPMLSSPDSFLLYLSQTMKGEYQQVGILPSALLASYNAAPHNRYQPHPAEPEQHISCSNRAFVLLKMGIMMPETC